MSGSSVVPGLPNTISTPSCLRSSRKAFFPDIIGTGVLHGLRTQSRILVAQAKAGVRDEMEASAWPKYSRRALASRRLATYVVLPMLVPLKHRQGHSVY